MDPNFVFYFNNLKELFPNQPDENVINIIECVTENKPCDSVEDNFNIMSNMMISDEAVVSVSPIEIKPDENDEGIHQTRPKTTAIVTNPDENDEGIHQTKRKTTADGFDAYFERLDASFSHQPRQKITNIINFVLENDFERNLNIMMQLLTNESDESNAESEDNFEPESDGDDDEKDGGSNDVENEPEISDEAAGVGVIEPRGDFSNETRNFVAANEVEIDDAPTYEFESKKAGKEQTLQRVLSKYEYVSLDYVRNVIECDLPFADIVELYQALGHCNDFVINPKHFQLARLISLLPRADPTYLLQLTQNLANTEEALNVLVNDMLGRSDYPKIDEYRTREAINETIRKYKTEFTIKNFLKEFKNPEEHFTNASRVSSIISTPELNDNLTYERAYASSELYNHYLHLNKSEIDQFLIDCDFDVVEACARLDLLEKGVNLRTMESEPDWPLTNITLYQELAFAKHREAIKRYQDDKIKLHQELIERARLHNMLQSCDFCGNDEIIPEESVRCPNGCICCINCLERGVQAFITDGKFYFPCFYDCGAEFSMSTVKMVLNPVVYYRMLQRRQIHIMKLANIEGIEKCPFCPFQYKPVEGDKIFKCQDPDCGRESCRGCQEEAHIPLRCHEVEYDEDVKIRTAIEKKIDEALLRTCDYCGAKIVKLYGCNKMTCQCGRTMCYICLLPGVDYNHFSPATCPIISDQNALHRDIVLNAAAAALAEVGQDGSSGSLKQDPTRDLHKFFK